MKLNETLKTKRPTVAEQAGWKAMIQSVTHSRSPHIVKTSRGILRVANVIGAAVLLVPMSATAQDTDSGEMRDLGSLRDDNLGYSYANDVSADGAVIVGSAETEGGDERAFLWDTDSGEMRDLGSLRDDNLGGSTAQAVSANGAIAVGSSHTTDDRRFKHAFRWDTVSEEMIDLGSLRDDNLGSSYAYLVSADGSVVVGSSETETDNGAPFFNPDMRAFRWDIDSGVMRDLGTLRADNLGGSRFAAMSTDGAVVVGAAETDVGSSNKRAFRWDTVSEEMIDLGSLRDDNLGGSHAYAISPDGAVIVGGADTDDGDERAFRLDTDSGVMIDLGSLIADNLGASYAFLVSADGAVVVGAAETDVGSSNDRVFRWDTDSEEMVDLGSLRDDNLGESYARAMSADGAVVVGEADTDDGDERAFLWDTDSGEMRDLGSLRDDNLGYSYAYAMSADGAVVVGGAETDNGAVRAVIWRTQMQDLENLMLSYPALANGAEIAVAQQQGAVGQLANLTCLAKVGASCMRTSLMGNSTDGTSSDGIGSNSSLTGLISYGYGVSDGWTLGGTLSLGSTSLNNSGFEMGSDFGAALRGSYSEGHSARTGWQGEVALGYVRTSGDITRGAGLDNVLLSTGQADMDTRMARASLGYGFNQAQGWLLTPTLGITNTRTTRDAYTETGGDFNASYDSLSIERTNMDLSLSAETAINDVSRLTLTGGLEHDLSADRVVLTGTSDMPGMETLAVGSTLDRRDTRSFFATEYAYDISATQTLSGSLKVGQAAFGSKPQVGLGISFDMKF
jgi:probable HAF family extracellular repeat protein